MTNERPERVTAALAERGARPAARLRPRQRPLAHRLHRLVRHGRHRGRAGIVHPPVPHGLPLPHASPRSSSTASWQREIVQDLLESAVGGLPDRRRRAARLRRRPHVGQAARQAPAARARERRARRGGRPRSRSCGRVKDAEEIARIRAAALLADAALERGARGAVSRGAPSSEVAFDLEIGDAPHGRRGPRRSRRSSPRARTARCRTRFRATSRSPTACSSRSTGARSSTATPRTARGRTRPGRSPTATATSTSSSSARRRPPSRPCAPVRRARRSMPSRGRSSTARATRSTSATGSGTGWGWRSTRGPGSRVWATSCSPPGHIVTVEPGVYVPGDAGVRIEDLVAVTEDGHDVLSTLSKELTIVH